MRKSYVSINLKRDENIIKLNEDAEQADIVNSLKKKIPELKKLYKDEKTPIKVPMPLIRLLGINRVVIMAVREEGLLPQPIKSG